GVARHPGAPWFQDGFESVTTRACGELPIARMRVSCDSRALGLVSCRQGSHEADPRGPPSSDEEYKWRVDGTPEARSSTPLTLQRPRRVSRATLSRALSL